MFTFNAVYRFQILSREPWLTLRNYQNGGYVVNNTVTHETNLTCYMCYGIIRVIVFDNILWFNPFPHTTILQQTTLNIFCQKIKNIMDNLWLSGKHCGKRRYCLFWSISSVVTMFSKSCLLQRRQRASIWGKGLITSLNLINLTWLIKLNLI